MEAMRPFLSQALIPPPPAADSAALALDEEVSRKSLAQRGTPRWNLAAEDANLMFPHAAGTFSCVLDASDHGAGHPTSVHAAAA